MEPNKKYKGSAMVMTIIAVAFLSIIATVIVYAAGSNVALKSQSLRAKKNFYTAETIVEDIYSGLGMTSMDSLSDAYKYTLSKKDTKPLTLGGVVVGYESYKDPELNKMFHERFIISLAENLVGKNPTTGTPIYVSATSTVYHADGGPSDSDIQKAACQNAVDYLNTFIVSSANAKVNSLSAIEITVDEDDPYTYKMVLRDVDMEFLEKNKENNYFSELTVDFNIELPNMAVRFYVENDEIAAPFKDYVFIASNSVRFTGVDGNVRGGVYAGDVINTARTTGIVVTNSNLNFFSEQGTVTALKDIIIKNSVGSTSAVSFSGCDIWADNLVIDSTSTKRPESNNVIVAIDANSSTHLADDLQFEAGYSSAYISGYFWGYGVGTPGTFHQELSAINVNGKNSTLNMNNLKYLVLAGKAYLMYNKSGAADENLMLPESLAMKGNQRYYVLPDKYLTITHNNLTADENAAGGVDVSQPVNIIACPGYAFHLKSNITEFFGYRFLDPSEPIKIKIGNSKYAYATLNFKDNKSAENYLRCLLDVGFYNSYFGGEADAFRASRADMESLTIGFIKNINSIVNINAAGATVASTASILRYAGGDSVTSGGENSIIDSDANALWLSQLSSSWTQRNRWLNYDLLKYEDFIGGDIYLAPGIDPSTYVYPGTYDSKKIPADTFTKNVFNNIVDKNLVISTPYYTKSSPSAIGPGVTADGEFVWIGDGDIVVPAGARYGCVVATGNVTFAASSGFNGIVISDGTINVEASTTYTNHIQDSTEYKDILEYLEKSHDGELMQYFIALQKMYNPGTEDPDANKISKLKYVDFVTYSNWRKTVGE